MTMTPPSVQENNNNNNKSAPNQFPSFERERIERERHSTTKYRRLYSALLSKHEFLLRDAWGTEEKAGSVHPITTDTESSLLHKIWISERNAMATGLVVSCTVLATLRFMTPLLVRRIGGEAKMQALHQADEEAKRLGYYKYQRAFAWIVEGGFSLWVGSRAYDYQSKHYSEGGYETLAKIPLCSGKSVIADKVCQEWVEITAHQVPKMFWKNLDPNHPIYKERGPLPEERAWHAIVQFSNNCVKRRAYERELWSKASSRDDKVDNGTTISLPTNVPEDVMLSEDDAQKLVQDLSQ